MNYKKFININYRQDHIANSQIVTIEHSSFVNYRPLTVNERKELANNARRAERLIYSAATIGSRTRR